MNWYHGCKLKDLLTAWVDTKDDDQLERFLYQRYRNVNNFLKREEISDQVRKVFEELRYRIAGEIKKIRNKRRTFRNELV